MRPLLSWLTQPRVGAMVGNTAMHATRYSIPCLWSSTRQPPRTSVTCALLARSTVGVATSRSAWIIVDAGRLYAYVDKRDKYQGGDHGGATTINEVATIDREDFSVVRPRHAESFTLYGL